MPGWTSATRSSLPWPSTSRRRCWSRARGASTTSSRATRAYDVEPLVKIHGLSKDFAGVRALDAARFELNAGEVHALMGENGAGKSTLMKVLAGIHARDAGVIEIAGRPVEVTSPREALALGIGIV